MGGGGGGGGGGEVDITVVILCGKIDIVVCYDIHVGAGSEVHELCPGAPPFILDRP